MWEWWAKSLGERGERAAARFLRRQGFQILARSYKSRMGEIDLIARDKQAIVFVEVKTRRCDDAGHPIEAVTSAKQKQLTRLALAFLKRHGWLEQPARFDIITVLWPDDSKKPVIEHYRNAFSPVGFGQMYS